MNRYLRCLQRGDADECAYCQVALTDQNRTIDHRVSVLRGGSNKLRNLCLACKPCNSRKGAMDLAAFLALLATDPVKPAKKPAAVAPSLGVRSRKRNLVPAMSLMSAESRYALTDLPRQLSDEDASPWPARAYRAWAGEWTPPYVTTHAVA